MIRFRHVLVCAAAAVAGCSAPQPGTAAPAEPAAPSVSAAPTSAAPTSATPATRGVPTVAGDEAGVRTIFTAYYAALSARDFDSACAMNASETNEALLANAAKSGITASTCAEALRRIYATPAASAAADQIVNSAKVESVDVRGDKATITWSAASSQGKRQNVTSEMRLVDGQWRLVDTGAR